MISHRNVIANVLQIKTYESVSREQNKIGSQVALGLLPFSHIYALVVVCHAGTYRGDEVVVLPKFELERLLAAVQKHKIQQMCIVSHSLPTNPPPPPKKRSHFYILAGSSHHHRPPPQPAPCRQIRPLFHARPLQRRGSAWQ